MDIDYMQVGAMQGWQCPICKRIYAPFVPECLKCNKVEMTLKVAEGERLKIDWNKTTEMSHIPQIY